MDAATYDALRGVLSPDEINQLIAYVLSQSDESIAPSGLPDLAGVRAVILADRLAGELLVLHRKLEAKPGPDNALWGQLPERIHQAFRTLDAARKLSGIVMTKVG